MILMIVILMFLVLSIIQLVQDDGVRAFRDVSFWLIIISFAAIASFVVGGISL